MGVNHRSKKRVVAKKVSTSRSSSTKHTNRSSSASKKQKQSLKQTEQKGRVSLVKKVSKSSASSRSSKLRKQDSPRSIAKKARKSLSKAINESYSEQGNSIVDSSRDSKSPSFRKGEVQHTSDSPGFFSSFFHLFTRKGDSGNKEEFSFVEHAEASSRSVDGRQKRKAALPSAKGSSIPRGTPIKTYISGFDKLVHPGIMSGSTVLVEGGPGSGKTLWCLSLLKEMCLRNKKVLFMSFEEPEDNLRRHINSFGLDSLAYEKKGLLYLKRFNALDIARSVEALLSEAKKELLIDVQPVLIPNDFDPDIVIIDSLSSISSAFSGESSRFRIYMEQLFRYLESHNITSFLIREVASPTHIGGQLGEQEEAVSFLSDGIIAIYNVIYEGGTRKRAIEILKLRGVEIERKIVEYDITSKGVKVYPRKTLRGKYKLT